MVPAFVQFLVRGKKCSTHGREAYTEGAKGVGVASLTNNLLLRYSIQSFQS